MESLSHNSHHADITNAALESYSAGYAKERKVYPFVRDDTSRKQWLLENGVSFIYERIGDVEKQRNERAWNEYALFTEEEEDNK